MARRLVPAALLALLVGTAAFAAPPGARRTQSLWVAPFRAECGGLGERCLLVSTDPAEAWDYLFDGIEGFAFEPGYTWMLKVRRYRLQGQSADADGAAYRLVLIEVLEKVRA